VSSRAEAWLGRVFTDGDRGGNHTVVVANGNNVADPAAMAARLGVPDTAFVISRDNEEIVLRTFSPVEELAQCLQTSLAVLTALDVPVGAPQLVRHEGAQPLVVVREQDLTWAHEASPADPELEEVAQPSCTPVELAPGTRPVVLRQARSRLHLRCADVDQLERLELASSDVSDLCTRLQISGIVLSASSSTEERVRVFTSSLSGAEDNATGGAVLGVGILAFDAGTRGDLSVRQGPADPDRQGLLRLRLRDDGCVLLGGAVHSLMSGGLHG
jgi:predicted PhzF superfamily epimerase YddE/YHI9